MTDTQKKMCVLLMYIGGFISVFFIVLLIYTGTQLFQ
jgi:hypothetical protein